MSSTSAAGQRCPSCTKTKMILDDNTGELFCSFCGFVVTDKIVEGGPEWRSFSNDGPDRSRVGTGTSITMHDMGLSTIIGQQNKDATGKPLDTNMKKSIERLRTWDNRSQAYSSSDRNLRQALSEMDKLQDKLSLADDPGGEPGLGPSDPTAIEISCLRYSEKFSLCVAAIGLPRSRRYLGYLDAASGIR